MPDLDSPSALYSLDSTGLGRRLRDLPRQCSAAWSQARSFSLPQQRPPISRVVIAGMGGSAIAGDLLTDLAAQHRGVPILVVRDFSSPFALDRHTLTLACSYSGSTQETLSLFRQAQQAGSQIIALTTGGSLAQEARTSQIPCLPLGVSGEPRSAVGYSLLLLLGLLERLGLVQTGDGEVQASIQALQEQVDRLEEGVPTRDNPAKQLAQELENKVVVVYGGGLFSGMARRWKTQLNENAKAWAFFEVIPELLHNSVEAYATPPGSGTALMTLLLLPRRGSGDLAQRYRVVAELLRQRGIPHHVLTGTDSTPLGQVLTMLALGDYVSYYLALLKGVDPSPVPMISLGKDLQAQSPAPLS